MEYRGGWSSGVSERDLNGNGGLLGGAEDVVGGGVLASCFRTVRFGFLNPGFFFLAVSVIFAQVLFQ